MLETSELADACSVAHCACQTVHHRSVTRARHTLHVSWACCEGLMILFIIAVTQKMPSVTERAVTDFWAHAAVQPMLFC